MRAIVFGAALFAAAPAAAEVKSATDAGFEVAATATVKGSPEATYAALAQPSRWWNSEHTYSGDAKNMTIEPRAGGCFCEAIPADKATIEHGRIVYAQPGKTLRFQGGLGPLQSDAVMGTMTWTLKSVPGGTEISQSYVAGGYLRAGMKTLAPLVDQVLAEQLNRLKSYLDTRPN